MTNVPEQGPVATSSPGRQSVLPLRLLIPAVLLLFTVAVGTWAYLAGIRFSGRAETQGAVATLTRETTTLQRTLEYLFTKNALEEVQQELAERGADPTIEAAFVIDENERIIATANRAFLGLSLAQRLESLGTRGRGVDLAPALQEAQARQKGQILIGTDGNVIVAVYPVLLGAAPGQLRASRLGALVIARDVAPAKAQGRQEMARLTGSIVLPMVLFAVLLLVGSHVFVTRRVTALVRAASRFAEGDRNARAGLTGQDELAYVGRAFDKMADEVAAGQRVLTEGEERLRLAVNGTTDGIWDWNLVTHHAYLSPRWNEILGYHDGELPDHESSFFERLHPDDQAAVEAAVVCHLEHRRPYAVEFRMLHKDGTYRWVLSRGEAVRDGTGKAVRMLGTIIDITERKWAEEEIQRLNSDLERRVAERTAELERANKELESFSYSVSHDLRGPLRAIGGFSQALLADYSDRVDDRGKDYLRRVHAASGRMADLIDALLSLARINRSGMSKQQLDLTGMARSIGVELRNADPTRNVVFTVQDSLTAEGDPHLMRIVLENLLGNAWKFTAKQPNPTIEFGRTERAGESVFFVRDNGVGFDMAYRHKLFDAFQRLHGRDEFEGTGIGLATVQRIIHRHGGRIWAEAEVGKGATFYFAI
jgi:PAS domain S-box-containing protein